MKNIKSIILACLILCNINLINAQQETPIEISPLIGDKLDRVERDYFGFLPHIDGFQEAVFHLNPDSSLKAVIKYEENGNLKDTVLNSYKSLNKVQNQILQIMTYHLNDVEPEERGKYCEVFLVDSSNFSGELLAVGMQSLLMYSMSQKSYEDKVRFPFKEIIPAEQMAKLDVDILNQNEIDIVQFKEKSKIISNIIYPLIGGIVGAIVGYNIAENHKIKNPGLLQESAESIQGALLGAGIGMIASIPFVFFLPIETTSETLIKTPFNEEDLEGLRDKSRYKDEAPYFLTKIK